MKLIKYFLMGFLATATVHLLMNASCMENSTGPTEEKVDVAKIQEGAKLAEDAFATADTAKLAISLSETSLQLYRPQFAQLIQAMPKFAEAFKQRQLSSYNHLFAEYEFFVEGQRYTVAFTRADDGSWKLVRF